MLLFIVTLFMNDSRALEYGKEGLACDVVRVLPDVAKAEVLIDKAMSSLKARAQTSLKRGET